MKKLFIVAMLISILSGCGPQAVPQAVSSGDISEMEQALSYFKDRRTGVCFATLKSTTHGGFNVYSITYVPCSAIQNIKHGEE